MKPIKTLIFVLALCGGMALLAGCSDDDSPTAPGPAPAPLVEMTWEARTLNVIEDCDASTNKGDFYISFKLSDVTSGEEVVLGEISKVLIKATKGELVNSSELDIALKGEVPLKNGARLLARMSIYENDPDGPQVSIGNGFYYTYSTVSNRWESETDDGTVTFDEYDSVGLRLEDNNGDPCWSICGHGCPWKWS